MALITFFELIDMAVITAIVGFIFMDFFERFRRPVHYDPLLQLKASFNFDSFKFACMAVAPAIILHELAHKFAALSFGMEATFKAAYFFLGLGLMMKLIGSPFIFFVPAYVSILGRGTALQFSLIAFAGPAMNLVLWLGLWLLIKQKLVKRKYLPLAHLTKMINMFLFIFNMLPIPGFDGYKVFYGLFSYLF